MVWQTAPGDEWTFSLLGRSLDHLDIPRNAVLHIGAHKGEEIPHYLAAGFRTIMLVEPDPAAARVIKARPDFVNQTTRLVLLLEGAVSSSGEPATFHRNAKSFLSGLQDRASGPDRTTATLEVGTMPARAIQALAADLGLPYNVLVIDTQGTEMDALRSARIDAASGLDLIIVEAYDRNSLGRLPKIKCAAPFGELEAYMVAHGWRRAIRWIYDGSGYFDVLYVPAERVGR